VITELLLEAVLYPLVALFDALPDLTIPDVEAVDELATAVGSVLGGLDGTLPITELATFVGWVLTVYVPVYVSASVTKWVYAHLPVVGRGD